MARHAYKRDAWASVFSGIYQGFVYAGPFYLIVARQLHASDLTISFMVAAPFMGNLLALFWANSMEGRPKMPFAVGSWVAARTMLLFMVIAVTPIRFAIIICLSQFLMTIASPAYAAIMKDVYPDDQRGRIMGYVRVLMAASMIATTFVAGWLLDFISYRWIFPLGGAAGIASALIFGRIRTTKPPKSERVRKSSTWKFLLSSFAILRDDKGFRWFAFSVFTYGIGSLIVAPIYPVFMVDRLNITTLQAGVLSIMTQLVWMVSYWFWGRYVDVKSPIRATVVSILLAVTVPINFIIASFIPSVWILIPQAVISGVINAGIELAYFNTVLEFSGEGRVSHYQAIFSWLLGIRGSIAPFLGGFLAGLFQRESLDLRWIFFLAAAIMLAGAVMQIVGMRRDLQNRRV